MTDLEYIRPSNCRAGNFPKSFWVGMNTSLISVTNRYGFLQTFNRSLNA